jgi:hypothetical protein
VPMITFIAPDDLNQELRDWIDRTLAWFTNSAYTA